MEIFQFIIGNFFLVMFSYSILSGIYQNEKEKKEKKEKSKKEADEEKVDEEKVDEERLDEEKLDEEKLDEEQSKQGMKIPPTEKAKNTNKQQASSKVTNGDRLPDKPYESGNQTNEEVSNHEENTYEKTQTETNLTALNKSEQNKQNSLRKAIIIKEILDPPRALNNQKRYKH